MEGSLLKKGGSNILWHGFFGLRRVRAKESRAAAIFLCLSFDIILINKMMVKKQNANQILA